MLLLTATLLVFHQISAQDLIFKKNGEIVKAKVLNATDKSVSYILPVREDSITHFINVSVLDSIIYNDGKKEVFIKKITPVIQQSEESISGYKHHLIGLDLTGYLFYRNLTLSYEFLPGKANFGYKVTFTKNVETVPYSYPYFNFSRIPDWSSRLGINYYFFPPRTFRLGIGLGYIFGEYSPLNYYPNESFSSYETGNKNFQGAILGFFGFYNLGKNLAINFGFDNPLIVSPSSSVFYTVIRCEILLNF